MGKIITTRIASTSQIKKGTAAQYISLMVVPLGATPFMTKRPAPNGGDVEPVSMAIR